MAVLEPKRFVSARVWMTASMAGRVYRCLDACPSTERGRTRPRTSRCARHAVVRRNAAATVGRHPDTLGTIVHATSGPKARRRWPPAHRRSRPGERSCYRGHTAQVRGGCASDEVLLRSALRHALQLPPRRRKRRAGRARRRSRVRSTRSSSAATLVVRVQRALPTDGHDPRPVRQRPDRPSAGLGRPGAAPEAYPGAGPFRHVGDSCVAVREAIGQYQPVAALDDPVHESPGRLNIGRTNCSNPGSKYPRGPLEGVLLHLDRGRVAACQHPSR
jgi:hypothetical protein